MSGESIRRWLEAGDEKRELVPVEIVPEGVEGEVVVVVSPRGYRVEGLGVASAAALLRMLG